MDIKEQRRERFEKQLIKDNPGAVTILHRRADGSYFNRYVQSAWDGWNSALDSAVVELPPAISAAEVAEHLDLDEDLAVEVAQMVNGAIVACGAMVKAAGLQVKS